MKKSIVLLYSGQLRTWKATFANHVNQVILPLSGFYPEKYRIEIVAALENERGETVEPQLPDFQQFPFGEAKVRILSPASLSEMALQLGLKDWGEVEELIESYNRGNAYGRSVPVENIVRQHYNWLRAWNFLEEVQSTFNQWENNVYVRMRTDSWFLNPLAPELTQKICSLPEFGGFGGVNDRFMVTTDRQVFGHYHRLFTCYTLLNGLGVAFHPETLLYAHLIRSFNTCFDRNPKIIFGTLRGDGKMRLPEVQEYLFPGRARSLDVNP